MARRRNPTTTTAIVVANRRPQRQIKQQNPTVILTTNPSARKRPRRVRQNRRNSPMNQMSMQLGRQADNANAAYSKLLLDPCNARLTYGPMSGSTDNGYLLRVASRIVFHPTGANNNGYVAWFPDFHNNNFGAGNLFNFETATPSVGPLNTALVPYGTSALTTAAIQTDPAWNWVNGTNCASARVVAACIRVFNAAPVSGVAGQLMLCTGLSPAQLLTGGSSGTPMSVNNFFTFGQNLERFTLETKEIKHAPSTNSSIFRPVDSPFDQGGNCVNVAAGIPSVPATTASQTNGIAVAWTGISTSNSNDIVIEFVKIIEWMPDANINVSEPQAPVRPTATLEDIQTSFTRTLNEWQTMMFDRAQEMGGRMVDRFTNRIVDAAWTGASVFAGAVASNRVRRRILVPGV
jgi:hypothetical protein